MYEYVVSQPRKSVHLKFFHKAIHGESVLVFIC